MAIKSRGWVEARKEEEKAVAVQVHNVLVGACNVRRIRVTEGGRQASSENMRTCNLGLVLVGYILMMGIK